MSANPSGMPRAARTPGFRRLLAAGLLALGLSACSAVGYLLDNQGTFHTAASVADLDGDGDLDVVTHVVRQESEFTAFGGATLWFNDGHGRFTPATPPYDANGGGWASAAADTDADGSADLLTFQGYQLRLTTSVGGAQAAAFPPASIIPAPRRDGQYGTLRLGDVNGDGLVDAVVAGCCGRIFTLDAADRTPNFSWVWLNAQGAGQTAVLPALDGLALRDAALGDLDGDGDLDLFAAVIAPPEGANRDPRDRVLLNDGAGSFTDAGQRLGAADSTAVALGDVDGDGDLDALVAHARGVDVWLNQGGTQGGRTGSFAQAAAGLPATAVQTLLLADLDGDGDPDALAGDRTEAAVWWNDGAGGWTRADLRIRYTKRHGLALLDVDGNGRIDVFAAAKDDYSVWFNHENGVFKSTPPEQ
ncbi:MAG: VCBS repeat-containing protein [Anaerolineales bacterium]|nr:VCBS repeat-containing protein [Anaerolineales bacterium]